MKKKRIFFMAGLYSLVVGGIVYIGLSLPEENTKNRQLNQRNEQAQPDEEVQPEHGNLPEVQNDFIESHLIEDEKRLNKEINGNQSSIRSEGQRSNSSALKGSTSEKVPVENSFVKNPSQEQEKVPTISDNKNERNTKDEKGNEEKMTNKETVLNSLGTAYEIQDNRDVDRWGVIIKIDRLPEALRTAKGYTVSIGEKAYELHLNKYNSNVFNTQVSSLEHTKEQIEQAILTTN